MTAPTYRMETVEVKQPSDWNDLIVNLENAHALQTWQWGQVKAQVGWQAHPLFGEMKKARFAPVRCYCSAQSAPVGLR